MLSSLITQFTFWFYPSLWIRAGSLLILVVAFQVLVAQVALEKETKRRLQHALTGHALVQISYVLPRSMAMILLIAGGTGIYVLQTFFPNQFRQAFGPLLRPKELARKELPGAFWFLVGTGLTLIFVDDWIIARYAVECLALADPMASWIGKTIPSRKINASSSLSGCIACFGTAMAVGMVMLTNHRTYSIYTLVLGAMTCTIAEALPFGNDNLNIPLFTALVVQNFGK